MAKDPKDIEFLYDVELELAVVLGTKRMLIRELLKLATVVG